MENLANRILEKAFHDFKNECGMVLTNVNFEIRETEKDGKTDYSVSKMSVEMKDVVLEGKNSPPVGSDFRITEDGLRGITEMWEMYGESA